MICPNKSSINPQSHNKEVPRGGKPIHPQPWQSSYGTATTQGYTATATFATLLTRDDTPWPNTVLASTNLFLAWSSWPIPLSVNEAPTLTFIKMEKSDEKAPPKQAVISPHNGPG